MMKFGRCELFENTSKYVDKYRVAIALNTNLKKLYFDDGTVWKNYANANRDDTKSVKLLTRCSSFLFILLLNMKNPFEGD